MQPISDFYAGVIKDIELHPREWVDGRSSYADVVVQWDMASGYPTEFLIGKKFCDKRLSIMCLKNVDHWATSRYDFSNAKIDTLTVMLDVVGFKKPSSREERALIDAITRHIYTLVKRDNDAIIDEIANLAKQ